MVTKETIEKVAGLIDEIGNQHDPVFKKDLAVLKLSPENSVAKRELIGNLVKGKLTCHVVSLAKDVMDGHLVGPEHPTQSWHMKRKPVIEEICKLLEVEFPKVTFEAKISWG